ncbi:LADA_0F11474g1_1 [Lachancea dasiensis]|uniref:LADA_0F11474g1_1 n=1 Tax=Lachancea dasiensis TaxID=1072105 RepID=A0A1G4JMC3_9SACH|nr:LADA_0F11474g1_1 [Lachancea dasiensis]
MNNTTSARTTKLDAELSRLQGEHNELQRRFHELSRMLNIDSTPELVMKKHITDLKKYNELRDTGLGLTQIIANEKKCKIKEVFEEMGYDMQDRP